MILSSRYRFLYVGIPKTGTHSVTRLLLKHYGGRSVGQYHGAKLSIPSDWVAWATVRNPYTRILSWWHGSREYFDTLPIFIRHLINNPPMKRGYEFLRSPQHVYLSRQPCTHTVRIEEFEEHFRRLPFSTPVCSIGRGNPGAWWKTNDKVADWYDTESLEAVVMYGVIDECRALGYPEDVGEAV